ncbi:sigma-70 family RNA polymerase sigma factor [Candidatus Woesearchaeota archaeon]|nr:sigma-70 family RNA polymerase sigma factor [Candidatus Woesearchaeota archaeon]
MLMKLAVRYSRLNKQCEDLFTGFYEKTIAKHFQNIVKAYKPLFTAYYEAVTKYFAEQIHKPNTLESIVEEDVKNVQELNKAITSVRDLLNFEMHRIYKFLNQNSVLTGKEVERGKLVDELLNFWALMNTGLIMSAVHSRVGVKQLSEDNISFLDLLHQGFLALRKCLKNWDPEKASVTHYCFKAVYNRVSVSLHNWRSTVHVPYEQVKLISDGKPVPGLYIKNRFSDLHESLGEVFKSFEEALTTDPRQYLDLEVMVSKVLQELDSNPDISKRDARIFLESFRMHYTEVARMFGLSHERVRQIRLKVLNILRQRIY